MGRHSVAAAAAAAADDPGRSDNAAEGSDGADAGAAPSSTRRSRGRVVAAVAVAILGIVLLVFGIISLNTAPADTTGSGAGSGQNSASGSASEESSSESAETSTEPIPTTTTPGTTLGPASPAVLPVTVLNNSPVVGLASRVASALEAGGWPIAELLNYSETQVPETTAFFTPGNAAEEAAAVALVAQFPQISGGAQPRFEGLDGAGLTLAAVGDWVP